MPYSVDIVVLSNIPKNLGREIEVKVGLPTKNPWSLPFGHKKILAERIEDYDLFIYSEDDILITRENIEAFLRITEVLPANQISGFLRYELDSTKKKWFPDFLGPYHWLPGSVNVVDQLTVVEFSNVHSACYIITRDQLRKAIESGGYLVGPHEGRYDLLCSAATDPYTQCGFKKVICISQLSKILVHHMSNNYVGRFGIGESDFNTQIKRLFSSEYNSNEINELFITTKKINNIEWDKVYYGDVDRNLLSLVSRNAKKILSAGCGYPSTEAELIQRDHAVTAIPLDPIVGSLYVSKGVKDTEPDFEKAFQGLAGTSFDCIIFSNVLQHLKDPADILSGAVGLLAHDGELLIRIPNFRYLKFLKDHFPYPIFKRWTYSKNYLHTVTKRCLKKWLSSIGVKVIEIQYVIESPRLKRIRPSFGILNILFGGSLLVRGKKTPLPPYLNENPVECSHELQSLSK